MIRLIIEPFIMLYWGVKTLVNHGPATALEFIKIALFEKRED